MRKTARRAHVAIIMDGNGRWARRRGRPRTAGHAEGARAVRAVVEAAAASPEVGTLTLYAFSSDNWQRPGPEVRGLMRLLGAYLRTETARCVANGIRLEVIGRRDRLPAGLVARIAASEAATLEALRTGGDGRDRDGHDGDLGPGDLGPGDSGAPRRPALTLRLAIDYSARDAILGAVRLAAERPNGASLDREGFARLLSAGGSPDVDLLIRTGGERRLSDFMLWECAYAELYFTPVLWPDFGPAELAAALAEYRGRDRRFGRILEEAS